MEIEDNPRFKKRFFNQVPSKFPKARDERVSNFKPQKGKDTSHQVKIQLVESVARSIMVSAFLERTIALDLARVATRLEISQIRRGKTREEDKKYVQMLIP